GERPQRRVRAAAEAEQPVRVVLHDGHAVRGADLEDLGAALDGQRDAGGVVEVRDRVQELRCDPLGRERPQRLAQQVGHEAVLIHRDVDDAGLVGGEAAERADVGRPLGQHDVAGVAIDARDEVERHLRAHGDDDVVGVGADALERHHLADLLAQRGHALGGAVLQGDLPLAGDEVGDLGGELVEREGGEVRHASGEGDHLRPARDGEERADLGGGHAGGSGGEPLHGRPRRTRRRCCCPRTRRSGVERWWGRGGLRHGGPPGSSLSPRSSLWGGRDRPAAVAAIAGMGEPATDRRGGGTGRSRRGVLSGWIDLWCSGRRGEWRRMSEFAMAPRRPEVGLSWHVAALTLDNLDDLPKRCRRCVFWELSEKLGKQAADFGSTELEKEAWVSEVLLEWGSCGRVVYMAGAPAGCVIYAPPSAVPRAAEMPTGPVSADAVLLTTMQVLPEFSGEGLGRMLAQAVVRDLTRRGVKAIEVFGEQRPGSEPGCLIPADFLR